MNRKQKLIAAAALAAVAATWAIPAQAGRTLNAVKSRGMVVCGVNTAAPGFSGADSRGHWKGLDVDICRAVAAAVLAGADHDVPRDHDVASRRNRRPRRNRVRLVRARLNELVAAEVEGRADGLRRHRAIGRPRRPVPAGVRRAG